MRLNVFQPVNKQFHEFIQGSPDWHEHRDKCYNASEVAMVFDVSPYGTRNELLKEKATGIKKEITYFQQKIFDDGIISPLFMGEPFSEDDTKMFILAAYEMGKLKGKQEYKKFVNESIL